MGVRKSIAIITATDELSASIAKTLIDSNYRLLLVPGDMKKVAKLASSLMRDAYAAEVAVLECEKEACWEADVILMAVPHLLRKKIAELIQEVTIQKVVISLSNLTGTYEGCLTSEDISIEELQDVLPYAKVVTATTTLLDAESDSLCNNKIQSTTFIAADDEESLQTAGEIITAMGLSPVVIAGHPKQHEFFKLLN